MNNEHYVLITQGSCPFCADAISLLKEKGKNFIYTDMENAPEILKVTKIASGHETVPMIWAVTVTEDIQRPANNEFVGGYEELKKHLGVSTDT